jgi:hypothetical protein
MFRGLPKRAHQFSEGLSGDGKGASIMVMKNNENKGLNPSIIWLGAEGIADEGTALRAHHTCCAPAKLYHLVNRQFLR